MKPKKLKIKLPKGFAPFGKMEVIAEKNNLYLVVNLISADFKQLLEIIIKNDNQ